MGGDTPSACRHRPAPIQLDTIQPKDARRGCYSHAGAACAVVVSCTRFRDFWGGLKGAGTSKPSPPDAVRPAPPLPPTCVCCRWGGGCGQRPSARDAPAPHMLCWVLEVHVWVTDRLSRSGRDRTPPVGASGSMKASCKKAQVLGFFGGALYCYVTRLPSPHPLGS